MAAPRTSLRAKIQRSLLIDQVLQQEIQNKAAISLAQAKAYYDKNPDQFRMPESFAIQTISIIPPDKATAAQLKEARKKADDALKQAKATKDYETFGVLAEKISEDDFRVMMGDHHEVERQKLPPEVVKVLLAMKPGQVSDLVQFEGVYTRDSAECPHPGRREGVRPGERITDEEPAAAKDGTVACRPGQEAAHRRQGRNFVMAG